VEWDKQPLTWPNRAFGRMVECRPHRWYVQEAGSGALVLLLHGAGASTHSFRALMPDLARDFHVLALDLPGQGFSRAGARHRLGLEPMAADIAALLAQLHLRPDAIIGHSAGAAIALRLTQILPVAPRAVVAINGALGHFKGVAGWLFPALAKLLALNPLTAMIFARTASSEESVRRLLTSTGSRTDAEGVALYRTLVADRGHVDGTLAMMSQWSLETLLRELPQITVPVLFLTGANDRAVPPDTSDLAAARMPNAEVVRIDGLGHMLHEEDPGGTAARIRDYLGRNGVGSRPG